MITDKETADKRLALCKGCINYRPLTISCGKLIIGEVIIHNGKEVRLCGCIMEGKVYLTAASCPIGKW